MSNKMAAMQRMGDLDWLFLGVEHEVSHMHLGAVAVFEVRRRATASSAAYWA
jgi:hypothetical protein